MRAIFNCESSDLQPNTDLYTRTVTRCTDEGEPAVSLRDYRRIRLGPGGSRVVHLRLTAHDFATADEGGSVVVREGVWRVATRMIVNNEAEHHVVHVI